MKMNTISYEIVRSNRNSCSNSLAREVVYNIFSSDGRALGYIRVEVDGPMQRIYYDTTSEISEDMIREFVKQIKKEQHLA